IFDSSAVKGTCRGGMLCNVSFTNWRTGGYMLLSFVIVYTEPRDETPDYTYCLNTLLP
ncbi:10546_t:CDS:1, partial [Dentiscutata erythropus]